MGSITKEIKRISWAGITKLSETIGFSLLKPINITFDITDRCQLKCLTCTKWKTPPEVQRKELRAEEWEAIILRLKQWLGEFSFIFSGGEPFLRRDIFRICSFATENGVHPRVITNGCGFSFLAKKIVNSGLQSVTVSLNGMNPKIHDTTRGVEGAHRKTLQFIGKVNRFRKMQGNRLKLSICTILMPFNCEEATKLLMWVQTEGINAIRFQPLDPPGSFNPHPLPGAAFVKPKGADSEWYRENYNGAATEKLRSVIDQLIEFKKQGFPIDNSTDSLKRIRTYYNNHQGLTRKCRIGVTGFNVDSYGNVRLCFDMEPIGNITETSPRTLYNNKKSMETRHRIRLCKRLCHWAVC